MSVKGTHVLQVAESHIGAHEEPMGSNRGPFVQECQAATGLPGTGWPWCAGFVCRVAHEAGVDLPYKSAGAWDLADHYPSVPLIHAKPGDVIAFNIGSGHTGILKEKIPGEVITVDGNWADAVQVVYHSNSLIRRIWRMPGVDDAKTPPRKRENPFWTIATSMHGHRVILLKTDHKSKVLKWIANHAIARIAPNGIQIRKHHG